MILDFIMNKKNNSGFSLIEAMVATVIVGLGFTGVYTLTAFASKSIDESMSRQKLQLVANQIYEIIESDITNIDSYNIDLSTCTTPAQGATEKYITKAYEWCMRMNTEIGSVMANDSRAITVTTLSNQKAVELMLSANNGKSLVVMKRVYE
jgi:prepilin-type N-terminal cleavage/methylation domain-containing protein